MQKLLSFIIENKILVNAVLSKSTKSEILKAKCRLVEIKGEVCLQIETFYSDNKVFQKNVELKDAVTYLESTFLDGFKQLNIFTTNGDAEIKISKKGKILISDNVSKNNLKEANFSHNKEKQYILPIGEPIDFLVKLGVQDQNGRVYDKKTSKFRQINKFLENVKDVEKDIISGDELYVVDLCCGKSYLSFAVYYYFTKIKGLKVKMDCVDLKKDVIDFCNQVTESLNYSGLRFICGDVSNFKCERQPDLTVSLHACDVATDIVLLNAIKSNSKVILSTPCCHHQLMGQLKKEQNNLDLLLEQSILKQKFADALTDSLRCKALEIAGYSVNAVELIDPEETPKNVLIRAIKKKNVKEEDISKYKKDYIDVCALFNIKPFMYDEIINKKPN